MLNGYYGRTIASFFEKAQDLKENWVTQRLEVLLCSGPVSRPLDIPLDVLDDLIETIKASDYTVCVELNEGKKRLDLWLEASVELPSHESSE